MEFGAWADWATAIVAVVALILAANAGQAARRQTHAAMQQAGFSAEQLSIANARSEALAELERSAQASQISAWGVAPGEGRRDAVRLSNGSAASVFNVRVDLRSPDGAADAPLRFSQLPPGHFLIGRQSDDVGRAAPARWTGLREHAPGSVDLAFADDAVLTVTSIAFTDARGAHWHRDEHGALRQMREPAADA